MAEISIRLTNNWMRDADKTGWSAEKIAEAEKQYEIGDIESIYEDGYYPANVKIGTPSVIVKIPGITKAQIERLLSPVTHTEIVEGRENVVMDKRRKFKLEISRLPLAIRNDIQGGKKIFIVSAATAYNFIRNKVNNQILTSWTL